MPITAHPSPHRLRLQSPNPLGLHGTLLENTGYFGLSSKYVLLLQVTVM